MRFIDKLSELLASNPPDTNALTDFIHYEIKDVYLLVNAIDKQELEQIRELILPYDASTKSTLGWQIAVKSDCYSVSTYENALFEFFSLGKSAPAPTDLEPCPYCGDGKCKFMNKQSLNSHIKRKHNDELIKAGGAFRIDTLVQLYEMVLPYLIPGKIRFYTFHQWWARDRADNEFLGYTELDAQLSNKLSMDLFNQIDCYVVLSFGNNCSQSLRIKNTPAIENLIKLVRDAKKRKEVISALNKAKLVDKEVFVQTLLLLMQMKGR